MTTDTAHIAWNAAWATEEGRAAWETPAPQVVDALTAAKLSGAATALDMGCGVGRHALAMAQLGFETTALDASDNGLEMLRGRAGALGVSVDTRQGMMTALPFADAAFDFTLSWNVIYHGDPLVVHKTAAELTRVTKPGGRMLITMLSKRRHDYGRGVEVAKDTFVQPGAPGDKSHPHFFVGAADLLALFPGFETLSLVDNEGAKSGTWHFEFLATRVG